MKIAHLADVHLDAHFAQFSPEAQRKRQVAIEESLKHALRETRERNVDMLVIAGDLYEQERFTPSTANFLRHELEAFELPVYISPGNHDYYSPTSLYATVEWSDNVHVFKSAHFEPHTIEGGLTLWGAAHLVPAQTVNFLDGFAVDRAGIHVALFHGAEEAELVYVRQLGGDDEAKAPYAPFRAQQVLDAGLHHAFLGHIHTALDADHHTYPGNPEPLTFGEGGGVQRGLVVATLDERGGITRERINVAKSSVRDVVIDLTDCQSNSDVRETVADALRPLDGFVRATLEGEVGDAVDIRLDELRDSAPIEIDAITFRFGRLHIAYPIDEIAKETGTVRGRFVGDVLAADLDEETKHRVIVTGLRALDGRSDLAVT
jgi:DNA repair exonuclease SbcCD nuclease subunit